MSGQETVTDIYTACLQVETAQLQEIFSEYFKNILKAKNCRNILKSEHSFSSACRSTTAQTSFRETPTLTTPSSLARSYSISISNLLIENTRDFKLHLPCTAHPNEAALLQSTSHNHSWEQLCLNSPGQKKGQSVT